jgi:hypothetical protein
MIEKSDFSERLRLALKAAGLQARPSVVEREFNSRWSGSPISTQAAWSWLNAKAIPAQDKLQVLAEWLRVEPEVLRFGERVRHSVQEHRQRWDDGVGYTERETFDAFLRLPAPQRKLIREVIFAFAQVYAPPDAGADVEAAAAPALPHPATRQKPARAPGKPDAGPA